MSDIGEQYKSQSEELKKLSAHYNNISVALKEMNDNYRILSEKLEQLQVNGLRFRLKPMGIRAQ